MLNYDIEYRYALHKILHTGYEYLDPNRKGVKRKELGFLHLKFKADVGYPILTLRRVPFKNAVSELILFLKGVTDIREYWKQGIKFWDQDVLNFHNLESFDLAVEHQFDMGKIYPYQYRKLQGMDQIDEVFTNFKNNPMRTDLVVTAWNPTDFKDMCLKACHHLFQIVGENDGFNIVFNMKGVDLVLGFPVNIQHYYLLGKILEQWSGYRFKYLVANLNKVHIYDNQYELAEQLINSEGSEIQPNLQIQNIDNTLSAFDLVESLDKSMFTLHNYFPDEKLKPVKMLAYDYRI